MSVNKNVSASHFSNIAPSCSNQSNYYELLANFNQKLNTENEQYRQQQFVSEQSLNKNVFVGPNRNNINLNNSLMSQIKIPAYKYYFV